MMLSLYINKASLQTVSKAFRKSTSQMQPFRQISTTSSELSHALRELLSLHHSLIRANEHWFERICFLQPTSFPSYPSSYCSTPQLNQHWSRHTLLNSPSTLSHELGFSPTASITSPTLCLTLSSGVTVRPNTTTFFSFWSVSAASWTMPSSLELAGKLWAWTCCMLLPRCTTS